MKRTREILDSVLLALVSRRLAGFRKRGDSADRFSDGLVALLSAEIERRNKLFAGWDAELKAAEAERAERTRRALAAEKFQSFEPEEKHGLRLQ